MALRLRRGLDVERQSVIFAEGEPIYTTDTKKIYMGDGATPGGLLVSGLTALNDDVSPRLSGPLDLNGNEIVGTGDVNIIGNINISGSFNAGFIDADYRGSLFAHDSSIIVDGNNKRIMADTVGHDGTILVNTTSLSVNITNNNLEELLNVAENPVAGGFLQYDGTSWSGKLFGDDGSGSIVDKGILQFSVASNSWTNDSKIYATDSSIIIDTETGFVNISNQELSQLSDVFVDYTTIDPDDVLSWDGSSWVPKSISATGGGSASELTDLTDVTVSNPTGGDILQYTGFEWQSTPLTLDNLLDVSSNAATDGDWLRYDGTGTWYPGTIALGDLADTQSGMSPALGDQLVYDGTVWAVTENKFKFADNANLRDILSYDGFYWTPQELTIDYILNSNSLSGDIIAHDGNQYAPRSFVDMLTEQNVVSLNGPAIHGDTLFYDNAIGWYAGPNSLMADNYQGDVLGYDSSIIVDATTNNIHCQAVLAQYVSAQGWISTNAFIKTGQWDTTTRDNDLTGAPGMIIYNTTVDKFQGFAGGVWVDLH